MGTMSYANRREPLMDQNFIIVTIGLFLLLGIGIIGYIVYIRLHGLRESPERWRKDLIRWQILGPNTLPQTLAAVKCCRDYLFWMAILANGICILLSMMGWAIALCSSR